MSDAANERMGGRAGDSRADLRADPLAEHVRSAGPGLAAMLAEAEHTWQARAEAAGATGGRPGWRAFEDAFPTFYQFTNRPR